MRMCKLVGPVRSTGRWSSELKIGFFYRCTIIKKGLNMFLVPINISNFRFSPSIIFRQLLVLVKFSITTFSSYV